MIGAIFSAIVVYVCIWWIVFFCTLPIGIQSIKNNKDGSMPGAPINPGIKKKMQWSFVISAVLWAIIWYVIHAHFFSYADIAKRMAL